MRKLTIYDKVVKIIYDNFFSSKYFYQDEINEFSLLKDEIGLDAVDIIELSFIVEQEFEIKISDEEIDNWLEINDIIQTIIKHQEE